MGASEIERAEKSAHEIGLPGPLSNLSVCPECDAVWRVPPLIDTEAYTCGRCGTTLAKRDAHSLEAALAASIASFILLAFSVSYPFLSVERSGLANRISVLDAVGTLWEARMPAVTLACFFLIFAIPAIRAALLCIVLFRTRIPGASRGISQRLYRAAKHLEPWAMMEIFLIGVVVSLVKVGSLANVTPGPAFWGMCGLVGTLTFVQASQCPHTTWEGLKS